MAESCHLCGAEALSEFAKFPSLPRVTSDCRPFRPGGRLALCRDCGGLQKIVGAGFEADCREIYGAYRLYHQGQGGEQRVFDQKSGASRPRSALIIDHLERSGDLGETGRLLDIGCGEGYFLAAFGGRFPGWSLEGLDIGTRYRDRLLALPGVAAYHGGDPSQAQGPFDAITLNHTLEHIPHPADYLRGVHGLLAPGGLLQINVPDWRANAFDLTIADHCTHFDSRVLENVLTEAGFALFGAARDVIPKEWLVVAEPGSGRNREKRPADKAPVRAALDWLEHFVAQARGAMAKSKGSYGIFGTAIAGVWLDAALDGKAAFFVDEDPGRAGNTFMGRPVLTPSEVPPHATVHLAFPRPVSLSITERLAGKGLDLVIPEA